MIKNSLEDFVEMTNLDELLLIMEVKQLLTTYDIAVLNQKLVQLSTLHVDRAA